METLSTGGAKGAWQRLAMLENRRQFDANREDKLAKQEADERFRERQADESARQFDVAREDKLAKQASDESFRERQAGESVRQFDTAREDKLAKQMHDQEWSDIFNRQQEEINRIKTEKAGLELDAFHKLRTQEDEKQSRLKQIAKSAMGLLVTESVQTAMDSKGNVLLTNAQMDYLRENSGGLLKNITGCTTYKDQYGEIGIVVTFSDPELDENGNPVVDEKGNQVPRMWNLGPKEIRRVLNASNYGDEKMTNQMIGTEVTPQNRSAMDAARVKVGTPARDLAKNRMEQMSKRLSDISKIVYGKYADDIDPHERGALIREARNIQKVLKENGYSVGEGSAESSNGNDGSFEKGSGVRKLGGKSIPTATGRYASATRSGGENISESTKDQSGELINVNGRTFVNGQTYQTPKGLLRAVVKDGKLMWSRK